VGDEFPQPDDQPLVTGFAGAEVHAGGPQPLPLRLQEGGDSVLLVGTERGRTGLEGLPQPAIHGEETGEVGVDPLPQSGDVGTGCAAAEDAALESAVGGDPVEKAADRPQVLVPVELLLGEVDLDALLVDQEVGGEEDGDGERDADGDELVPDPRREHQAPASRRVVTVSTPPSGGPRNLGTPDRDRRGPPSPAGGPPTVPLRVDGTTVRRTPAGAAGTPMDLTSHTSDIPGWWWARGEGE
jgi:hypothetical protein